ncbi:hypothetical protein AAG570_009051 [Ranatra chinensis]|uniref:Uncharacterized protein n=1 Tax=Ranatra chinensis TaxID=642074 RepID=A0ABD0YSP8_9HEMI
MALSKSVLMMSLVLVGLMAGGSCFRIIPTYPILLHNQALTRILTTNTYYPRYRRALDYPEALEYRYQPGRNGGAHLGTKWRCPFRDEMEVPDKGRYVGARKGRNCGCPIRGEDVPIKGRIAGAR